MSDDQFDPNVSSYKLPGPGEYKLNLSGVKMTNQTFELKFETSKETAKIDEAFAKAQAKFMTAVHDKKGARNNSYATVGAMLSAARQGLGEEKVHVTQWLLETDPSRVRVLTRLSHAGEYYQCVCSMPVTQSQNPQSHGSSYTYLRRYALIAVLGLVDADTDDDGAGGPKDDDGKKAENDPIASAKEPAKVEKKEVKNYAPKLSPMQQVGDAMKGRSKEVIGAWIRARYPKLEPLSMTQGLAEEIIKKIKDTPDEGFNLELSELQWSRK